MEPITLTTSFATIISLLASYKTEQRSISDDDYKSFMSWLAENNQNEIKDLLELNTQATIGIKALLSQDKKVLLEKLDAIDEIVSNVASRIEGFEQVAIAFHPDAEISEQAFSVLKQLMDSGCSKFLQSKTLGREPIYIIMGGTGGQIKYHEPQFIEDDLSTLVRLGLLNLDYNSKGSELYIITRSAGKLIALTK